MKICIRLNAALQYVYVNVSFVALHAIQILTFNDWVGSVPVFKSLLILTATKGLEWVDSCLLVAANIRSC